MTATLKAPEADLGRRVWFTKDALNSTCNVNAKHIAILTFEGFNEFDSLIAFNILAMARRRAEVAVLNNDPGNGS